LRGRGTYEQDKPPIIAMLSRESGEVVITPSTHVSSHDILKRVVKRVEPEATIYHDDYPPYSILDGLYKHESVNHSAGEYAREGGIHINTVEAEFSILRPWLDTYRGISKEHTYLYCSHYQHLRNTKNIDRVQRAILILLPQQATGPPTTNHI
jgi:transposase-like protein